jgi:hypothetical protein
MDVRSDRWQRDLILGVWCQSEWTGREVPFSLHVLRFSVHGQSWVVW